MFEISEILVRISSYLIALEELLIMYQAFNVYYFFSLLLIYFPKLWCLQAWTSSKAREVVSLGRELMGGNGILADFLVAKVYSINLFSVAFQFNEIREVQTRYISLLNKWTESIYNIVLTFWYLLDWYKAEKWNEISCFCVQHAKSMYYVGFGHHF